MTESWQKPQQGPRYSGILRERETDGRTEAKGEHAEDVTNSLTHPHERAGKKRGKDGSKQRRGECRRKGKKKDLRNRKHVISHSICRRESRENRELSHRGHEDIFLRRRLVYEADSTGFWVFFSIGMF